MHDDNLFNKKSSNNSSKQKQQQQQNQRNNSNKQQATSVTPPQSVNITATNRHKEKKIENVEDLIQACLNQNKKVIF
jgi:hypothetical protein